VYPQPLPPNPTPGFRTRRARAGDPKPYTLNPEPRPHARLLHEACESMGGMAHASAGPNARRTLLMAEGSDQGSGEEGVKEAVEAIDRAWEERWRRGGGASGANAKRSAARSAGYASFAGFGRAPLMPRMSASSSSSPSSSAEVEGLLAKLLRGDKGAKALVNATYFSGLLSDMGLPPKEKDPFPERKRGCVPPS